jgi:deazaflavin-dependent oxidoreductase (nitroreductase family)
MSEPHPPRYLKPMNKVMMAVQRLGIPTGPAMVLTVPGRKSGRPRSTPMTPFEFRGDLYAVAGYPGADWAANARAAGTGTLARGRRSREVRIVELTPEEARPVLWVWRSRSARGWCAMARPTNSRHWQGGSPFSDSSRPR